MQALPSRGAIDVRASFLRFPGWTQHFWTWLTGKALPGQRPLVRHSWKSYLAVTLACFFSGLALSTVAVAARFSGWELALVLGWLLTLSAARVMILVIAHQCIHKQFTGSALLDRFVGELVTVLSVYQDAHAFKLEHFDSHHREHVFATVDDPPVQVLLGLGFCPGMSRRRLWARALLVFVSPRFYLAGFASRLRANLESGTWRRAGFVAWASFWLSLPFWLPHGGAALLWAFALPIIPLAQLSALLDKLGEHAWLTPRDPLAGRRHYHVAASWARFCGCAVPPPGLSWRQAVPAWAMWCAAMLLHHLPARLLVIVGDLPSHDFHHREPATHDWMVAAYARQGRIDEPSIDEPPYTDVWGMVHAIDRMFRAMSALPALEPRRPMERGAVPAPARGSVEGSLR